MYPKYVLGSDARDETSIASSAAPFSGRLYVLVDGLNRSATFQFAQIGRGEKLGTFVGEPIGGNLRGTNGGAFSFLTLPNSHIEMDVPLIGTFPPAAMPDAGLLPDVDVEPTADDIAGGRDRMDCRKITRPRRFSSRVPQHSQDGRTELRVARRFQLR